jgi:hypothetical protein
MFANLLTIIQNEYVMVRDSYIVGFLQKSGQAPQRQFQICLMLPAVLN